MGEILQDLVRIKLPDREAHNSRLFVDLCENIHIHHREFRIVFSLDEYFEFVDIIRRSTEDVRSYLAQNPDFEEGLYGTTLMVAGGADRQRKLLEKSPQPNRSKYFANDFAIELQTETVTDEIHVHWRDYRFALNRDQFKKIADAFTSAKMALDDFESRQHYARRSHHDRTMEDFEKEQKKYADSETRLVDEVDMKISDIQTRFKDIEKEFQPSSTAIKLLENLYRNRERVFPILLSTEKNGDHIVIDGSHRYLAAIRAGLPSVNCIISSISFDQSEKFRKAEWLLKEFDRETGYRYDTSAFNREFFAYKMGRYYRNHFYGKLNPTMGDRFRRLKKDIRPSISQKLKRWPTVHVLAKKVYHAAKL